MSASRLGVRVSIGSTLIAVILGITWLDARSGAPWFQAVIAAACALGAVVEYLAMCGARVSSVSRRIVVAGSAALLLARPAFAIAGSVRLTAGALGGVALATVIVLLMSWVVRRRTSTVATADLEDVALAGVGVVAIAWPLAFLGEIGSLGGPGVGPWILATMVLASKGNDIGGYLVGSAIGRHKLAPGVSPNKSVEGAIAGAALGTSAALACFNAGPALHGKLAPWQALVFGLVIAVTTQLGDLAESFIKRAVGVKDSAALLPAFGGLLDLVDSFLFSAPAGYTLLRLWGL